MGRKQLSATVSGVLVLAIMLFVSSPAEAGVVRVAYGYPDVIYSAQPGESNQVTVTVSELPPSVIDPELARSRVIISDTGAPVTAGQGCQLANTPLAPSTAVCDVNAYPAEANNPGINVNLGDGNDQLSFEGPGGGLKVIGGPGNDKIYGSPAIDFLFGGSGDDYLAGLGGSDFFLGGPGRDYLLGGDARDALDGGLGKDKIYGGTGNDVIGTYIGNCPHYSTPRKYQGNNKVNGGTGNDKVNGGAGNDVIGTWGDGTDC